MTRDKRLSHSLLTASLCALLLGLCASSATAEEGGADAKASPPGWSGKLGIGFDSNAGNTNTRKSKGMANFIYNEDFNSQNPIRHTLGGAFTKSSRSNSRDGKQIRTVDREAADYKLDYFINERSLARAFAFYFADNKAFIDAGLMAGVGYEYGLFKNDTHRIILGAGLSMFDLEYIDDTPPVEGPAARFTLKYRGQYGEELTFNQQFVYLGVDDDNHDDIYSIRRSRTALEYQMNKHFSIELSHEITWYSRIPAAAIDDKDDTTNFMLKYRF
jgi:putative salt-induced outer membrane protein YdiY